MPPHNNYDNTVSEKTKTPLRITIWMVGLAIYMTAWCIKIDIDVNSSVTREQFQGWIINEQNANRSDFPALQWTPLPSKEDQHSFFGSYAQSIY